MSHAPEMPTHVLWVNNINGHHSLIRGRFKDLVVLAESFTGVSVHFVDDIFVSNASDIEVQIHEDGFEPDRLYYKTISYAEPEDVFELLNNNIEPETYFKNKCLPAGFKMVNREAPYDFTRQMSSPEEMDDALDVYHKAFA
jgi:hypothetical protein